jgi:hypothetical protein
VLYIIDDDTLKGIKPRSSKQEYMHQKTAKLQVCITFCLPSYTSINPNLKLVYILENFQFLIGSNIHTGTTKDS